MPEWPQALKAGMAEKRQALQIDQTSDRSFSTLHPLDFFIIVVPSRFDITRDFFQTEVGLAPIWKRGQIRLAWPRPPACPAHHSHICAHRYRQIAWRVPRPH